MNDYARRKGSLCAQISRLLPRQRLHKAVCESLERRTLLSSPPLPIVPDKGEANLLKQANIFELKENLNALDHFPIPFAVVSSHAGGPGVVAPKNPHAGAGTRVNVDVDNNPATGPGGKDLSIEVNTELFLGGSFNPHLSMTIDRLGTAPFASNYEVLVSFPFAAFNTEVLPGDPNLFIGFKTTGPLGPDDPGGIAPLREEIRFVPNFQAGADHQVQIDLNTTGASNPLQFITGFFDGTDLTGILNASAYAAWVQQPPATISIGLGVGNSQLGQPITSGFNLQWTASSTSMVVFDYLEEESGDLSDSDFNTKVTFDQMPTSETLSISMDEESKTLIVDHVANSTIGKVEILAERNDGLKIVGTLTDVPTQMNVVLGLEGSVDLNVNANTLDLRLEAIKEGGFLDTSEFLGYDLGYVAVSVGDAPDLHAEWDSDTASFLVKATNPGESIGMIELMIDDDARYGAVINGRVDTNGDGVVDPADDGVVANRSVIDGGIDLDGDGDVDADDDGELAGMTVIDGTFGTLNIDQFLVGLATPPSYYEGLNAAPGELHHLFSVYDDGSHGTLVARLVRVQEAALDLDPDASQVFHIVLGAPAAPMQAYLRFLPTSQIVPGHDIEITCDIDDVPYGIFDIHFDGPGNFGYTTNPAQTIESIHCYGHIDTLNFDVEAGLLPAVFDFEFDPESHVTTFAGDGLGGPAEIGHVAARFWDEDGPVGLPDTGDLLGTPLRDARMRVDQIPSSHAEWTQAQALSYDGGSGVLPAVGDMLYSPVTGATAKVLALAGGNAASGVVNVGFIENGTFDDNAAIDVLDALAFDGQSEDFSVGDTITGGTSGATATVRRVVQIGGAGIVYVSGVSGAFVNNEELLVDGESLATANGAVDTAPTWAASVNGDLAILGTSMDFNTAAPDTYLGGVQFLVSTAVELEDPLPAANPDADHFATLEEEITPDGLVQRLGGGAFSIDEFHLDTFSSLNLHYDADAAHLLVVNILRQFDGAFFSDGANYQYDLNLVVDAIPQAFDFSSDLTTQFVYDASAPINSVSLAGVVDDTDDGIANGTELTFGLVGLPSEVRFGYIADEVKIINGSLDMDGNGAINGDDDGALAGIGIINGLVDLNGSGVADASDNGSFFGVTVIGGLLNVDGNGGIDGTDDGGLAGAEVKANGGINTVGLLARSVHNDYGLFDSDFRTIQALVDNVPAHLLLSYGGARLLVETRDASGNPDGLDSIQALVSTTKDVTENNTKVLPFTLDGPVQAGAVLNGLGAGGSRINYSHFLQEVDKRYYNAGDAVVDPSQVLSRLANLYAGSEQLDTGEDHLLVRMENLDESAGDEAIGFASLRYSDFQHVSWTPDANGGQFIYRAPGRGNAGFFAGYEQDDTFTSFQIDAIPDEIVVDLDDREHLTYTASASPGDIDVYYGPGDTTNGLFAADNSNATRGILRNTPSSVRIFWDFSFPNGGAFMDASNPFDLLFLTQDGTNRITAGLTLEDLHVGWGIDLFSFDITKSIEIWNPFGDNLVIPVAWELFQAKAGIDNNADGLTLANVGDINQINGTNTKQDVAGFFALYDLVNNPSPLVSPAGPAAGSQEFVPFINIMTEGFEEFSMDFIVELDPTNPGADLYPIDLEFNVNTSKIGNLVFDIWSKANTDFTDDDDIPFIPEVGFVNPPDYTDNTPFHILPGLFEDFVGNGLKGIHVVHDWVVTFDGWHAFNEHFDPFAGVPAPFPGNSGNGGFNAGDFQFLIEAVGPFNGALQRWQDVLASSGQFTEGEAADLMSDVANNTEIQVASFGGAKIGQASGNSAGATIQIDPDAGGFNWFIDTTPFDNAEFGGTAPNLVATGGGLADGKVDMLTFFMHEIGHILGLGHADAGVMQANLPRSVRRLPVNADVIPGAPPNPAPAGDDVASLRTTDDEEEPLVAVV